MKKVEHLKDAIPDLICIAERLNLPMNSGKVMEEYLKRRTVYGCIDTLNKLSMFIANCLRVNINPADEVIEIVEFNDWKIPEEGSGKVFLCTDGKDAIIFTEDKKPDVVPLEVL